MLLYFSHSLALLCIADFPVYWRLFIFSKLQVLVSEKRVSQGTSPPPPSLPTVAFLAVTMYPCWLLLLVESQCSMIPVSVCLAPDNPTFLLFLHHFLSPSFCPRNSWCLPAVASICCASGHSVWFSTLSLVQSVMLNFLCMKELNGFCSSYFLQFLKGVT